jgi:hypothetical protein
LIILTNKRNIFKLKFTINIIFIQKEVNMIGDKRGLSTIVVTLIIILLSLVAVGVVWVVVRNLVSGGSQGVEISSKCLSVNVEATKVNCSAGTTDMVCDLQLMRTGTGSDEIGGVKLVFKNDTSGVSSNLVSVSSNIEPLVGLKQTGVDTGILVADGVDKVEVTVFFKDASGNEQICSETNPFSF